MPRYRTKPINAFLQRLMDERGWKTLKEASEASGLTIHQLKGFANLTASPILKAHLRAAEKIGVPLDVWVKGLIAADDNEEDADLPQTA